MRLMNKMELRNRLNHSDYDNIAIWKNGEWAEVGTGYGGEKSGKNPFRFIKRAYCGEMTHRAITELFRDIEGK